MRRSRRFVPILRKDCRKKKRARQARFEKNPQISPITQKELAQRREDAKLFYLFVNIRVYSRFLFSEFLIEKKLRRELCSRRSVITDLTI